MAETAVNCIIDKLAQLLIEEVNLLGGVHDDVISIKDLLESMRSFLKDADAKAERSNTSSSAKTWVKQTREMANHIEDVIDQYMDHIARRRNKRGFTGFFHKTAYSMRGLVARHELASEIQLIKERVLDIQERSVAYGFNSIEEISFSSLGQDDPRMGSHITEEADIVAMETPRDRVIHWSLRVKEASQRAVTSVVGMGGLGKTTLVKKVYDNPAFTEQFDWRAWITVSQTYKIEDILRKVITDFHKTRKESIPEDLERMDGTSLVESLREYLWGKRYAIVFDDVWSIELWKSVKHALPNNNNGSSIIITTRSGEVAHSCQETSADQVYELPPLPLDKACQLFCNKTFREFKGFCPPELKQFSRAIVTRSGGLPLAIVAISGLLATRGGDVSQWRKLHDSLGSELESNPHLAGVTKILSFSYHDLPYQLKPCFLYFGTYPENYTIRCSRLIRQWIAQGFIKEQKGKTLEEVGEEYLTELIQRSLVQVSFVDGRGIRRNCQIHDVMREAVILLKTRDMSFSQFLEEDSEYLNGNVRHVSVYSNAGKVLDNIGNSHAHSLLLFNSIDGMQKPFTSSNLSRSFKLLRVLDFEDSLLIDNLGEEVGYIYHLKYLSLRNTRVKSLPKSIGKLVNLETLDLKQSLVLVIPIEINKLPKLRNLLAYNRDNNMPFSLTRQRALVIPDGIKCWGNLQKLYCVEATDSLVKDVGNLKQLRKLGIQKLTRKQGKDLCASIDKMPHLKSLDIYAINGDEVIDLQYILSPPQFLHTLILKGRLEKLPDWTAGLSFLVRLSLSWSGLEGDQDTFKVLQSLPNLMRLNIYEAFSCDELHFEGGFPKLKELFLRNLNGLKMVKIHNGALPLAEYIEIGPSPQLEQVPSGIQDLQHLKCLAFFDMPVDFVNGIRVQETEERAGPRVFVWNTEGGRARVTKVLDHVDFV